jgi:dolichol-phosphate mannosyltransferase
MSAPAASGAADWKLAVVIPCYKVKRHVLQVISSIGPEVSLIYVVDDCCPEQTGAFVAASCTDKRVRILSHDENLGVGAAVMTGYRQASIEGADIAIKIDGDGQMDPALIPNFVAPIARGEADYTKGNRFYDLRNLDQMPSVRIFGNACLSFLAKISTGYWNLFDPTNGYTAIHLTVCRHLPLEKISKRYFFETDILFRLNTVRGVVVDIPMDARYADERSNLTVPKAMIEFLAKHLRNTLKRVFYNYYLRDLSVASFELPIGALLLTSGLLTGASTWLHALDTNILTPTGTIMLSVLSTLVGLNLLLAFIAYDVSSVPQRPIHRLLPNPRRQP